MTRATDRIVVFWAKVQATATCWFWLGPKSTRGYGRFWDGTRRVQAHRFAYEQVVGPIPDGLLLDHLCRVRACVNPAHLEPVTNRENLLRGEGLPAMYVKRTHCPQGHEYTPENTTYQSGGRVCRECHRVNGRRYYHAVRSAGLTDPDPAP